MGETEFITRYEHDEMIRRIEAEDNRQLLPLRMQISGNKIQYRLLNFTTDTDVAAGRVIYFDVLVKHK